MLGLLLLFLLWSAVVVLRRLVVFWFACVELPLSSRDLGHQLVRHDLLVADGVSQVVAGLVLRGID